MGARHDRLHERALPVVEVEARDLVLRHHDVVHGDLPEIQQPHQHGAVAVRHPQTRLAHHRAELLRAEALLAALRDPYPEQPQQAVGEPVHGPDQGVEEPQQRSQDPGRGEREPFRLDGRRGLGRDLGEDDDDDGEGDGRERDPRLAEQLEGRPGGERGREDVDEVVAEDDEPDDPIRLIEEPAGPSRPRVDPGQVAQPVAVEGHEPGLGAREEGRHHDQDQQGPDQRAEGEVGHLSRERKRRVSPDISPTFVAYSREMVEKLSEFFGSGRQDAAVTRRTDREALKGEPEEDEAPVVLRPGERAIQGWIARMFEAISERLSRTLGNLRRGARLSEDNIAEALREVRRALLEADVALPVAREFLDRVRERAVGQEVLKSLTPGQALVGVVHEELVRLMAAEHADLVLNVPPPAPLLVAGLQGSGKTTTCAKLARWLDRAARAQGPARELRRLPSRPPSSSSGCSRPRSTPRSSRPGSATRWGSPAPRSPRPGGASSTS